MAELKDLEKAKMKYMLTHDTKNDNLINERIIDSAREFLGYYGIEVYIYRNL